MNYRHAFHAGNFADVMKHAVLARILLHLGRKETPFRVVDTHAGIGLYDLDADQAQRTGEWRGGIGRVLDAPLPAGARDLLAPYLDLVRGVRRETGLAAYPGSPLIAQRLTRPADRLLFLEKHPQDVTALSAVMAGDRRVKVLAQDGWTGLRAHLPPREKRGLVLVDPPFEEPDEFARLADGLRQALQRFAGGVYMLWYPIKDPSASHAFVRSVADLGAPKLLRIELLVRRPHDPRLLNGSGLLVVNAPWTLADEARTILDALLPLLATTPGGSVLVA